MTLLGHESNLLYIFIYIAYKAYKSYQTGGLFGLPIWFVGCHLSIGCRIISTNGKVMGSDLEGEVQPPKTGGKDEQPI